MGTGGRACLPVSTAVRWFWLVHVLWHALQGPSHPSVPFPVIGIFHWDSVMFCLPECVPHCLCACACLPCLPGMLFVLCPFLLPCCYLYCLTCRHGTQHAFPSCIFLPAMLVHACVCAAYTAFIFLAFPHPPYSMHGMVLCLPVFVVAPILPWDTYFLQLKQREGGGRRLAGQA